MTGRPTLQMTERPSDRSGHTEVTLPIIEITIFLENHISIPCIINKLLFFIILSLGFLKGQAHYKIKDRECRVGQGMREDIQCI